MSVRDLPTKNNLIKLQAFIKQSKQGHKLLEQKKLILTRELDKYKQKEKALKEQGKNIVKEAENSLKLSNVSLNSFKKFFMKLFLGIFSVILFKSNSKLYLLFYQFCFTCTVINFKIILHIVYKFVERYAFFFNRFCFYLYTCC